MGALFVWLASPGGAVVTSVALTLATWTYHKVRGDNAASVADLVRGVGKQIVDALVKSGDLTTDALTARAKVLMASAMKALHVPDNPVTNALALAVVQHAVGDALAELRELATNDDANLATIERIAASMKSDMAAADMAGKALVAPMKDMVEVVPPDPPSDTPRPATTLAQFIAANTTK